MFWWKLELIFDNEIEESLIWKLGSIGINNYSIEYSPENLYHKTLNVWLPSYEWSEKDRSELTLLLKDLTKPFFGKTLNFKWVKIIDEN